MPADEGEARRQGPEIERLVEQTVNCLLRELEREENEGTGYRDIGYRVDVVEVRPNPYPQLTGVNE